jgi:hypothetical protein
MWAMGGSIVKVALGLVPLGVGFGMVSISTIIAAQVSAPPEQQGMASASPIFFRSLGGTIGPAIVGAFLYGALRRHGASVAPIAAGASFTSSPTVKRALTEGAIRGLWFGIGCALVAFLASRWLPRPALGVGRKQTKEGAREPNAAVRK